MPDLDRIIKMSNLFGVSVDYLVKNEAKEETTNYVKGEVTFGKHADTYPEYSEYPETEASNIGMKAGNTAAEAMNTCGQYYTGENAEADGRLVSAQEAENYMNLVQQTAPKIALGVTMCILSPVLLIILCGLADNSYFGVTEGLASGVGVMVLLCIVAAAVSLFIINGLKLQKYEYLEKEKIMVDAHTRVDVEKRKSEYEPEFQRGIVMGVIMCIVSVIPLVGAACLLPAMDSNAEKGSEGLLIVSSVALLLIIVSVGVNILVRVSSVWGSYQKLLQEGDYTEAMKEDNNKIEAWAGIYWCMVTAVYLGFSFTGILNWGRSWIIWPVAGVAFGAICGIIKIVSVGKK